MLHQSARSEDIDVDLELIFHGTGTSSGLPLIECLTVPPENRHCRTCLSSLTPAGRRNARRNTGAIIRIPAKDSAGSNPEWLTIVIDVGKSFQASALEWFPKYGLSRIDAVLITHPHADAMNGLDDLRGWTLRNAIQSHIDIYLTKTTFTEVNRSFPYLVNKEFGSGGGDLPEFEWHIIEESVPFDIRGISILPFPVQHGRLFTTHLAPPGFTPTPSTPKAPSIPLPLEKTSSYHNIPSPDPPVIRPYMSLGFAISDLICWISDVSLITEEVWELLTGKLSGERKFVVSVVDCLGLRPHTSHFGIKDSIAVASRLAASQAYLLGFGHEVPHEDWVQICQYASGLRPDLEQENHGSSHIAEALRRLGHFERQSHTPVRPAFDGLKLRIRNRRIIEEIDPWS